MGTFDAVTEQLGIQRGGSEPCHGPPEAFTIIGRDISAEDLSAKFSDTTGPRATAHARARALIKGARDLIRAEKDPDTEYVRNIGEVGQTQRAVVARLGADKKGREWVIVIIGRKRNLGLRLWNKGPGKGDKREFLAEVRAFPNTDTIDAELLALDANAASNIFIAMSASERAEHAVMHREKGRAPGMIALRIGARNAEEVELLFLLHGCSPEVKEAVDGGRVALADVATLAKFDHEEQARRIARKSAGPSRAAKNGAAPPRPKAVKRDVGLAMAERINAGHMIMGDIGENVAALVRYLLGDRKQVNGRPWLLSLVKDAETAAKEGHKGSDAREAAE